MVAKVSQSCPRLTTGNSSPITSASKAFSVGAAYPLEKKRPARYFALNLSVMKRHLRRRSRHCNERQRWVEQSCAVAIGFVAIPLALKGLTHLDKVPTALLVSHRLAIQFLLLTNPITAG